MGPQDREAHLLTCNLYPLTMRNSTNSVLWLGKMPTTLRVSDLPALITASKADWLAGTTWLGFTPTDDTQTARNQCQGTIQRQFANGYVIEYITEQFSSPNPGFERDLTYLEEREAHKALAGRLIAVHKLKVTARSLEDILGREEYKRLQDMWAQGGKRYRWSVAFPIIETYEIVGRPKAKDVLGDEMYRRLYQRSSSTLRVLTDEERAKLKNLEIKQIQASNAWIGIEDEFAAAEASQITTRTLKMINADLADRALEGTMKERWAKVRRRAAWIADKFIRSRTRLETLRCDDCGFDPATIFPSAEKNILRSLLDVHHRNPLDEGIRYTTTKDFSLLCPTCHRVEHQRLKQEALLNSKKSTSNPSEAQLDQL
ncbi:MULTISPECIES: HNH endonuclease [unclassified Azospirillum]|uniref:HNH endonuclease n=1 Tax=unclassified Azospirillum TaxID=2630922 RepID=UPI000D65BC7F|nr:MULTISPECIES: HNH endonuclease [unclassified Azospirillum]